MGRVLRAVTEYKFNKVLHSIDHVVKDATHIMGNEAFYFYEVKARPGQKSVKVLFGAIDYFYREDEPLKDQVVKYYLEEAYFEKRY